MYIKRFIPAFGWLVICTILLLLPGSSFPKEDWLSKIWFDKWVHIGLFIIMVFLWCWGLLIKTNKYFLLIASVVLVYGIVMEFVQQYFVSNRYFDIGDIVADAAGCIIGYFFGRRYIKK